MTSLSHFLSFILLLSLLSQSQNSKCAVSALPTPNRIHLQYYPKTLIIDENGTALSLPAMRMNMKGPNVVNPPENRPYLLFDESEVLRIEYTNMLYGEKWRDMVDGIGVGGLSNSSTSHNGRDRHAQGEQTLIHAHGVINIPSNLDGVPYISALPLSPGDQQYVEYKLQNEGTLWLHSHYAFQLGMGLNAPLVVREAKERLREYMAQFSERPVHQEIVMMLEEMCPVFTGDQQIEHLRKYGRKMTGAQLHAHLMSNDDPGYCQDHFDILGKLKKRFEQDLEDGGFPECVARDKSQIKRQRNSGPYPDTYDVWYKYRLANDHTIYNPIKVKVSPGKRIRVRIINASSFTTYRIYVHPKLRGTIVATDGDLIKPIPLKPFWMGSAQRVDLLLDIPEDEHDFKGYPIRAVIEDSDHTVQSAIVLYAFHKKEQILNPPVLSEEVPGFYDQEEEFMYHALHPLSQEKPVTKYVEVHRKINELTTLERLVSHKRPFNVSITGDNGFDSINNHSYLLPPFVPQYERNKYPIRVSPGDRVVLRFKNNNVDLHPMHVHGTKFQVIAINDIPTSGAIRDTVIVDKDCNSITMMFDVERAGQWIVHCHMEFHQNAGQMMTIETVAEVE